MSCTWPKQAEYVAEICLEKFLNQFAGTCFLSKECNLRQSKGRNDSGN